MRGFSKAIIAGNLTRDPETRTTNSGTSVCSFNVAINRRYNVNGEQRDEVSYIDCSAWGRTGETIQQYMHKGDPILLSGRLRQDRWKDKETGKNRSAVELVVEDFNFISGGNTDTSAGAGKSAGKSSKTDEVTPEDIPEGEISLDEVPF